MVSGSVLKFQIGYVAVSGCWSAVGCFQVYGTVGENGDFGTESGVNLIRMTWEWVGFEACE